MYLKVSFHPKSIKFSELLVDGNLNIEACIPLILNKVIYAFQLHTDLGVFYVPKSENEGKSWEDLMKIYEGR